MQSWATCEAFISRQSLPIRVSMVPPAVRERVQARRAEIVAGRERVFAGPIADQQGTVRIPADAVATDQELLGMNWFVQGVVGTTE